MPEGWLRLTGVRGGRGGRLGAVI
ncbi:MAG: hypothetical protein HW378_873, partial [Anaerolineales bacterium]|nr:hypothetical protein [Anaerolineales bacterium]